MIYYIYLNRNIIPYINKLYLFKYKAKFSYMILLYVCILFKFYNFYIT